MPATYILRKPPASRQEWEKFHFLHYQHHLAVIKRINALESINDQMPPAIWPFNPANQQPYNEAHQLLHQQMDAVSGIAGSNFLHYDLTKPDEATDFVWYNFVEHDAFNRLVGF